MSSVDEDDYDWVGTLFLLKKKREKTKQQMDSAPRRRPVTDSLSIRLFTDSGNSKERVREVPTVFTRATGA